MNDNTSGIGRGIRRVGSAIVLAVLGLGIAGLASAACSDFKSPAPSAAPGTSAGAAHLVNTVYRPDAYTGFSLVPVWDDGYEHYHSRSIVGLWEFTLLAPDGSTADYGLQQWHDDGTEFMISVARDPALGDVCMGVWRQVGRAKFHLKHLAMGYQYSGTTKVYSGLLIIEGDVTVDPDGDGLQGNVGLTPFAPNPADPFDQSSPAPGTPFPFVLTARRVTPD